MKLLIVQSSQACFRFSLLGPYILHNILLVYLMKNTNYEASHYAVFSSLLLHRLS